MTKKLLEILFSGLFFIVLVVVLYSGLYNSPQKNPKEMHSKKVENNSHK